MGRAPFGVAVSPDGRTVYVTDDSDQGTVSMIDTSTAAVTRTVPVGDGPTAVTVLAERAAPIEELTHDSLDKDIEQVELQRDATEDLQKREELNGQIVQLRETKALLKL